MKARGVVSVPAGLMKKILILHIGMDSDVDIGTLLKSHQQF
jgi:hypothetical protein